MTTSISLSRALLPLLCLLAGRALDVSAANSYLSYSGTASAPAPVSGRCSAARAAKWKGRDLCPLPSVRGLVVDSGFDEFIRANWPELIGGMALELKFLVPAGDVQMIAQARRAPLAPCT